MSHPYVRSKSLVGCAALALVLGCGHAAPVHLGEVSDEFGGDRACGSRSKHILAKSDGAAPAAFERRLGAARMTAESLACAAREATSPAFLVEANEAHDTNAEATRCEAEAQCYDGFHVTGDAEADVAALGERCGRACGMTARTVPEEGASSEDSPPRVYAITLDATRCYRVFAVGAPGVRVLAAAIVDRDGHVAAIDNSRDRAPILGPRSAFCPASSGQHRLVVSAVHGAGAYFVQVWSRSRDDEEH